MAMSLNRGLDPRAIWDLLLGDIDNIDSIGLLVKDRVFRGLFFFDDFNRTAEDTDIWTSGGDAGTFARVFNEAGPTHWRLTTGNIIDNDRYIHGDAVINNKQFSVTEEDYESVHFKARVRTDVAANISALLGLFVTGMTDYSEILNRCAHFFADPVVSVNYQARSYEAAEEQTDTGIAIDTDFHEFEIIWTAASVLFYIDGALVATHAAQVPTYRLLISLLIRTEAAAAIEMDIDYVQVVLT